MKTLILTAALLALAAPAHADSLGFRYATWAQARSAADSFGRIFGKRRRVKVRS